MQERSARKRAAVGPRIVVLLAALLAASSVCAQRVESQESTTIDAERIDGVGDLEITARGDVELKRDGTKIFADFLRYNQEFGRVDAHGGVRLEREGDRFFGPSLRFDTMEESGVFDQPTYVIQREQTARGKAARVDILARDRYHLSEASYTTCQPGQEDWRVEAGELELDYRVDEARATDGRLKFFDTTVLALPYANLPLDKQRKSGFLAPYYAQTSKRGLEETGVFDEPTYLIQREQTARGKASRVDILARDRYRLSNASYTTCRPGQEDWRVEAGELELDYRVDEARATDGKLKFFDTTVLALPYANLPLDKQRKSGFLAPYYAQTSKRGLEVGVPYYWNIAPEADATIMPVYMSKRGVQLRTDFRYLGRAYSGNLRLEYLPDDRVFEGQRTGFSYQHTQQFTPQLSGVLNLNHVSDDQYFADLASKVQLTSIGVLPREGYLQYNSAIGPMSYGATLRVQTFQTLQDPLSPIVPPHERLPQLVFNGNMYDIAGIADLSLPIDAAYYSHESLAQGGRFVTNPTLSFPLLAPGAFLRPKIGLRYSTYDLTRLSPGAPPGATSRPSAVIPWGSVDTGLIFERPVHWRGLSMTQTLEPRAFYVYIPYRNQSDMPIFDTGLNDFNFAQIFTENRFSGNDRFGDANQITLALTSRLLNVGAFESLRATVAQQYFFESRRVGIPQNSSLRTDNSSDVLFSFGGQLAQALTFDTTFQYKPGQQVMDKYNVAARYSPAIGKVLSASYRYQRDNRLKQLDISGQWPIARGWYAVGRYNYSSYDRRLLEGLAGFEYNAGCWVFRAVVQSLQTTTDSKSTGVYFQIQLNGLGEIGTRDIDTLLQRSVRGYSPTNPRDPTQTPPDLQPGLPFQMQY